MSPTGIEFEEDSPVADMPAVSEGTIQLQIIAAMVMKSMEKVLVELESLGGSVLAIPGPLEGKSANSVRSNESTVAYLIGQITAIVSLAEDVARDAADVVERP